MPPKKAAAPKKAAGPPVRPVQPGTVPASTSRSRQEILFPLVGKKRVAFIKAARELDDALKGTYGSDMTISKFERILNEVRGRSDLKDKLFLEDSMMLLHHAYAKAKAESMDELVAFRQSFSPSPVISLPEITSVDDLFSQSK